MERIELSQKDMLDARSLSGYEGALTRAIAGREENRGSVECKQMQGGIGSVSSARRAEMFKGMPPRTDGYRYCYKPYGNVSTGNITDLWEQ